jgi:PAS domain S-box-containing protein
VNFFALLENSKDGYFAVDTDLAIVYANTSLKERLRENGVLDYVNTCEIFHPDSRSEFYVICRSLLDGQRKAHAFYPRIVDESGEYRSVFFLVEYIEYDGRPLILCALRNKLSFALETKIYQDMVDAYPDVALVLDTKGNILAVNRFLVNRMGVSHGDILKKGLSSCIPYELAEERMRMLNLAISSGEPLLFCDCSNEYRTMEHYVSPVKNIYGEVDCVVIFCRDISRYVETEQSNRVLAHRLLTALEDERKKIAYELHDGCGQLVTMVGLGLSFIQKEIPDHLEYIKRMCDKYKDILDQLGGEIKNMSSELHPDIIDYFGLIPAVQWYLKTIFDGSGTLAHTFTCTLTDKSFGSEVDIAVYRIIQESLKNVIRHSGAKHVLIRLTKEDNTLRLTVEDDGVGFGAGRSVTNYPDTRVGLGMLSMKERAAALGGRLIVKTTASGGAGIDVEIPLDKKEGRNGTP